MGELELLKLLVTTSGSTIGGVIIIGYLYWKNSRNGTDDRKILISLIKTAQQDSRELTKSLTTLCSSIDEFNRVNGQNQKECRDIREAMTQEVTRLTQTGHLE